MHSDRRRVLHRVVLLAAFLLTAAGSIPGQPLSLVSYGSGAPGGNCSQGQVYTNTANGDFYVCVPPTWTLLSSVGGGINQLTGDVTAGPGAGSQAATLATVNSNVGACGDSTHVSRVTLNAKGLATACAATAISNGVAINQLTGDVTAGPGAGSQATTLATVNSNVGTFGDASHVAQVTLNAKGLATAASSVAITKQLHAIQFTIDGGGSAIATGALNIFPTTFYACTITQIDIAADQSGSITVDVWKANAAIPTSGNKISASAPLTLSSAQLSQNGSLTGWTTSVASGDVFGFSVATASTVTKVVGTIWCQ